MTRSWRLLAVPLVASLLLAGCFGKKQRKEPDTGASAEPDKVLYERAMDDNAHGRYTVGRLTLQTLINTYPDSEYLAKAKLAIADSYYKEGGTSGLTQAVAEYKEFIVFFPFLDEAAYAQMQMGMAHYRSMEKPDRDRTEARLAEQELQTFLEKYPDHPLADQAAQRLREVQEVLAEGDYRIARYYYIKGNARAAAGRLLELTSRYPLYSQADKALWILGQVFERNEKGDIAARYYARLVREYPLSELVEPSKERLTKLGVPIPQPDAEALARMQKELEMRRSSRPGLLRRSLGILKSGPDVSTAARYGQPTMTPPSDSVPTIEPISPGGKTEVAGGASAGNSAVVATVVPGSPGSTVPPAAENAGNPPAAAPGDGAAAKADPAAGAKTGATPDPCKDEKNKKECEKKKKEKESSSKKKKGLRKIIPW